MCRAVALALAVIGLVLLSGAPPALAQELPPRPELPGEQSGGSDDDGAEAPGLITGTVIDLTTGAPVAGIPVTVGDLTVLSDANGNYGRAGLAPGSYTVALALPEGRGVAEQPPATISLAAGQTVVYHLAFRSPPPALAEPVASEPTQEVAPVQLPATGSGAAARRVSS
jgi:hypothetical protein